jgi:two-component system, chemotaxis family, protein-glutamate methylesterase/glutaminase
MSARALIVIGASWGGLDALRRLLRNLPDELDVPIAIAQHRAAGSLDRGLETILQRETARRVREVEDKEPIERSHVYLAPPDYHLLVERGSFALSVDERVQYARPSIDVLFESAADAYGESVIGVILTGANEDGAAGVRRIVDRGGVAIVQDPETAARRTMPDAALAAAAATVLPLEEIAPHIASVCFAGTGA